MIRLTLEIPRLQDIGLLLAICKRLNITVVDQKQLPAPLSSTSEDADISAILSGIPDKTDWDSWTRGFEEQRQDRPLQGRD